VIINLPDPVRLHVVERQLRMYGLAGRTKILEQTSEGLLHFIERKKTVASRLKSRQCIEDEERFMWRSLVSTSPDV
jgi:hypothetical protein